MNRDKTPEEIERERKAWEDLNKNFGIEDLETLCGEVDRTRPDLSFFGTTYNIEDLLAIRAEVFGKERNVV